ncbi:hypothetical protein HGM15179_006442 [Zosterops borbonicus]|uniref:Uncharacterized protein n=1 Tax=Zosterops borbonicus TaxID=364589 RepID=A0A8K1GN22_9PASS|nr:hypothetical protein HGM15179_006442 [Zosterops borbonicus]
MSTPLLVLPHHLEDEFLQTPGNTAFCCIISHGQSIIVYAFGPETDTRCPWSSAEKGFVLSTYSVKRAY